MKYVLITAARNEQAFIAKTMESVVTQTLLPEKWIIVDDGSEDGTPKLVEKFARPFPWIELVRQKPRPERSFAGKVWAFAAGEERVKDLPYDVLGNVDADISFEPDHFAFLLSKFEEDARLGVAGTPFLENGYDSAVDSFEGEKHVAGQCQLFRRKCFEDIGGYVPNPAGGVDWIAVATARMKGWKTRSFPEKRYHHYRPMGTAEKSGLASLFSYGEKDYYLGGSPLWELFRVSYRATKKPLVVGGVVLLAGYCWAAIRRVRRPVSPELVAFHRQEQMQKLRTIFRAILKRQKIDNFRVANEQSAS